MIFFCEHCYGGHGHEWKLVVFKALPHELKQHDYNLCHHNNIHLHLLLLLISNKRISVIWAVILMKHHTHQY